MGSPPPRYEPAPQPGAAQSEDPTPEQPGEWGWAAGRLPMTPRSRLLGGNGWAGFKVRVATQRPQTGPDDPGRAEPSWRARCPLLPAARRAVLARGQATGTSERSRAEQARRRRLRCLGEERTFQQRHWGGWGQEMGPPLPCTPVSDVVTGLAAEGRTPRPQRDTRAPSSQRVGRDFSGTWEV